MDFSKTEPNIRRRYELLLAAVIASRATSFVFTKTVLAYMEMFNLLAIRFLLAFCLLALLFFRKLAALDRRTAGAGVLVGVLFFLVMGCELSALKDAPTSTVSLLENCSILFVPIFEAVLRRRAPDRRTVLAMCLAFSGVACLTLQQGGMSGGVAWGLLAAVFYAAAILTTARVSRLVSDSLSVGIVQVGTMGVLSLAASLLLESPHLPENGAQWGMIAVLAVVCTGFGFTLQPVAQRHVSAERAGIFCAINPAVSTVLGVLILREQIGPLSFLGLILILSSIVVPYL